MDIYSVDKLIQQTRRLAAEYYAATTQTLPVSNEIARHDATQLLGLKPVTEAIAGVDALDQDNLPVQIKSRVIFQEDKSGYRIGQLNFEGGWQKILLVLLTPEYETSEIYSLDRATLEKELSPKTNSNRTKRGVMSVAKFKKIGELCWANS